MSVVRSVRGVVVAVVIVAGLATGCGDDGITLPDVSVTLPTTGGGEGTDPPATDPPATDPPATEPPATEPPATDPPATEPPATDPPATEAPGTTAPAADDGDGGGVPPWVWVLLGVVAVGLVAAVVVASNRRRTAAAQATRWRAGLTDTLARVPAVADLATARPGQGVDQVTWQQVASQVQGLDQGLAGLAAGAPDPETAQDIAGLRAGLSGLFYASDADRLLRAPGQSPSGPQLQQSQQAVQARRADVDAALARLQARLAPGSPG